ncbi:MAG: prepilin peptidase [Lachnospiraceae bacterium]|nr:prepilin peptidase [Lachnospiraceae bacterium]
MVSNFMILIFLFLSTLFDIKSKKIPLQLIIIFGLTIIGISLQYGRFNSWEILVRIMPGIFLLLISFVTKEAIGYGDGIVILLIGLGMDIQVMVSFIMIAFLLSAIVSIIILIKKKGDRQTRLPFMPFLLTAWCVCLIGGMV